MTLEIKKKQENVRDNIQLSIVVPFFNEASSIELLLKSIQKQVGSVPFEVIFVDNNSTDESRKIIEKYKNKIANLKIISQKIQGIGAARKKGFAESDGKIIASTDADVSLPEDWAKTILDRIDESTGIVGTYQFVDKGILFNLVYRSLMIFFDHINRIITGTFAFRGLNFAVKKHDYELSGGFNEGLSALEDLELSLRVKKYGKIKYLHNLVVNTGYRRFKGRFWKQMIRRMRAYYFRAIKKNNNKATDWDIIR